MNTRPALTGALALKLLIGFCCHAHLAFGVEEDGIIKIRLSYKIILSPKDHNRPRLNAQFGETVSDEIIRKAVDEMNALMASYWRGYRFELTEIQEVGSRNGSYPDPSHWFDIDFIEQDKQAKLLRQMEAAIEAFPELYAWREEAVNIYVNQATNGAKWKFRDSIVIGAYSVSAGWVQLHELGHYFDLRHTQGDRGVTLPGQSGEGYTNPGDDEIEDTVADLPSWSRNEIAKHNFSVKYEKLEAEQRESVDDVAENIMSYHFLKPVNASLRRLTEGQLDRWTYATLDVFRQKVCDGRTWFVDRQTPCNEGTSTYPYDSVQLAVASANDNGGDIILLRPGEYHETITINKPLTIRATRKGPASIGTPFVYAEISAE